MNNKSLKTITGTLDSLINEEGFMEELKETVTQAARDAATKAEFESKAVTLNEWYEQESNKPGQPVAYIAFAFIEESGDCLDGPWLIEMRDVEVFHCYHPHAEIYKEFKYNVMVVPLQTHIKWTVPGMDWEIS